MKDEDYSDFVLMLSAVARYYDKEIKSGVHELYFDALRSFDLDQVKQAIQSHISSSKKESSFMPMISDIKIKISGAEKEQAYFAWSKVMDAIEKYGCYHDVVFDDAAIHAAISDLGGWVHVSTSDHDKLSYIQHNFINFYNMYRSRKTFDFKNKLCGIRSSDDFLLSVGAEIPKVKYVGDHAAASEVEKAGLGANYKIKTMAQLHQLATENTKPPKIAQDVPDWLVGYEGIGLK